MSERFWSDGFDMDLPKVIPGLDEVLGDAAGIRLWTYGHTSHGRLNHPATWNTYAGSVAFLGLDDSGTWKPDDYHTDHPIVECTWREVVRDAWPHHYVVAVNSCPLWDTARFADTFMKLMYDLRGLFPLPAGEADRLRGEVLASLTAATADLQRLARGR